MVVPTRYIETAEFRKAADSTPNIGDSIQRLVLGAFSFNPPRPDEEYKHAPSELINVLLLNVAEPVLYRDPSNNMAFVILPWAMDDKFDYDYMHDIHPNKKAWGYFIALAGTRIDDIEQPMSGHWFYFKDEDEDLPEFELGKVETH